MEKATEEILNVLLKIEKARLAGQRAFSMNPGMNYIQASVTERVIKEIESQLKQRTNGK